MLFAAIPEKPPPAPSARLGRSETGRPAKPGLGARLIERMRGRSHRGLSTAEPMKQTHGEDDQTQPDR
jgi:hypothetical protein